MRRGGLTPPVLAVLAAADSAPYGYGGIFAVEVKGAATIDGSVYLNSEPDYRDQRCLTVQFSSEAATIYRKRLGTDPEQDLKGRTLLAAGFARRVRIDFKNALRMPTGAFRYRTHVLVSDPAQVIVVDPGAEPVREPATDDAPSVHV